MTLRVRIALACLVPEAFHDLFHLSEIYYDTLAFVWHPGHAVYGVHSEFGRAAHAATQLLAWAAAGLLLAPSARRFVNRIRMWRLFRAWDRKPHP